MAFERIQELENRLAAAASRTEEIDALNALALRLVSENAERASSLALRALQLSRAGDSSMGLYEPGMALSLAVLGELAEKSGDYQAGLKFLLDAQAVLETSPNQEISFMVWRDLGWTYSQIGDSSQAIDILQKALKLARERKDTIDEAEILNILGRVYGEIGEKEEAVRFFRRALKHIEGTEDISLSCLILNNLAKRQLELQDHPAALESASRAVEIARQLDTPELMASTLHTTGLIYLSNKEYEQANLFLRQALEHCPDESEFTHEIRLSLARVAIGRNLLDEAADLLDQSLDSAEARGDNHFRSRCHALLSQVYDSRGDLPKAIEHYKQFHTIKIQTYNQEAQQRVGAIMVSHTAGISQIEAEIYHLKDQVLRKEISDYLSAAAGMKPLATTDALTGLLNRRHLMTLGGYAFDYARQAGQPLSALMMDIDDFKTVNDRYGHLAGDRVLIEVGAAIQSGLRKDDLLGRFDGEEFVAVLPKTGLPAVQKVAERVLRKVSHRITRVRSHDIRVTLSIGISELRPTDDHLESLLERADQALYAAKRAGKNRAMPAWLG